MEKIHVTLTVNGDRIEADVPPFQTLLEMLRDTPLELTGTKEGCGQGACGACTVLLNGKPARSCIMLAAEADGADVVTIEGLAEGERLHPLQDNFMDKGAVQCGFCTPGMILTAKGLLDRNRNPSKAEIITSLSSNLCRCTGYKKIIEAVEATIAPSDPT
ncbi:MAG: (2Fe-2S)-binding protein [Pseudomonadota bacterium]